MEGGVEPHGGFHDRRAPESALGDVRVGDISPPLQAERRLTTSAWPISHALEFVAVMAVAQGLLVIAGSAGGRLIDDLRRLVLSAFGAGTARLFATTFVLALVTVPYVLLCWLVVRSAHRRGLTLAQLTGMRPPPAGPTIGLTAVYIFVVVLAAAAWGTLLVKLGVQIPNSTYQIARQLRQAPLTLGLLALVTVSIGPFVEEVVFRGIVLPSLRVRFGATWAIVGSALLFSVIHFQPLAIPVFFAIGIVLALTYLQTRSLWSAIALHSAYNLFVAVAVWANVFASSGR